MYSCYLICVVQEHTYIPKKNHSILLIYTKLDETNPPHQYVRYVGLLHASIYGSEQHLLVKN